MHRERLLLALMSALGLPQMGCGEKYTSEMCRALPADGQCMTRKELWKELRWNRKGCGKRLVSIDSEADIKIPNHWPGSLPSFTPTHGTTLTASVATTGELGTTNATGSTTTNPSISSSATGTTTTNPSTSSSTSGSTWPGHPGLEPELACCYHATWRRNKLDGCVEGRPLLMQQCGTPLVAALVPGQGWAIQTDEQPLPDAQALSQPQREAMAQEWKRIATQEHASIAAFARLSLELLRYGAPAKLIEECHACMHDEIRHAKLAIRWASHLSGQALTLGPMGALAKQPMSENLTQLALANLEEGCCNETLATLLMLDRADRCSHAGMQAAIVEIAHDEQRHAQFAWRLTQWFLEKDPQLWRVLDRRMQTLLAQAEPGQIPSASHELLANGKAEVLTPLWERMRAVEEQIGGKGLAPRV